MSSNGKKNFWKKYDLLGIYFCMKYIVSESQFFKLLSERYNISKDERIVLSDTPNFLQVLPLTETAACKYGSATKWCVSADKHNRFRWYKDHGWDVSMVMVKNPEIQEKLGTKKFSFNIYNGRVEIHNDKSSYFDLIKLSDEAGVYDEVKSVWDDYINFMVSNRGFEPRDTFEKK